MATRIVPRAVELAAIHAAVCRARRAGLLCSTCADLDGRAVPALSRTMEPLLTPFGLSMSEVA